jgi:hypothetical protein
MTDQTSAAESRGEEPTHKTSSRAPFIIMASFLLGLVLLIALNWN